jgi:hypothetical protein
MLMKYLRKNKGSLTVEAVISFTVFLSVMFLLLTMVKLVLVMTILNNAAVETAKTVATSISYPVAIINGMEESKFEKKLENLEATSVKESGATALQDSALSLFLGGTNGLKSSLKTSATTNLTNIMEGLAVNLFKEDFYEFKGETEQAICAKLVQDYISDCGINFDEDKLLIRAVKFPETKEEYATVHTASLSLSEDGSLVATPSSGASATDGDFNADDVIICLEYPYQIAMPFLPSFEVTLRSTAVEHPWLNGTGTGSTRSEGINIKYLLAKTVYVGAKGMSKCYHLENCMTLWQGSKSMSLQQAAAAKLEPCKVCNPPKYKEGS